MSPHEIAANLRAYQAALHLVRLDIQSEQARESGLDRIDETAKRMKRRFVAASTEDLEHAASEMNEHDLAVLTRYADEINRLNSQLERGIENPALLIRASRDSVVHYTRLRFILRRAFHRDALELGWLLTDPDRHRGDVDLQERTQDLILRIAVYSRVLNFQNTPTYHPLAIHTIFQDFDVV